MEKMTDAAKEARRAYQREWYRKNKDKAKQRQRKYWERKAAEAGDNAEVMDGCIQVQKPDREPIKI